MVDLYDNLYDNLYEDYLRSFCYHFVNLQEHIPCKEKNDFLVSIDDFSIYELLSFLTFGDMLVENENYISEQFVDSNIGKFVMIEADDSIAAATGYAIGKTIQRVVQGVSVPVKYLGKGVWWAGGEVAKKIKSAVIPGTKASSKLAKGLYHSAPGVSSNANVNKKIANPRDVINKTKKIENIKKFGKLASWVAIPAAAAAASYIIYKKFFSPAARKCKNSPDKAECMKSFKTNAIKAQIQKLMQNRGKCASSNEPQKCANKIDSMIAKKRMSISKL